MPGGLRTAWHCIFTGRGLYGKGRLPRLLPMEAAARRIAGSPSQSMPIGLDSSPRGRAFGSPRKLHLFAKASPFEERLPPRRGKMSPQGTKGGVWHRAAVTERVPSREKVDRENPQIFPIYKL